MKENIGVVNPNVLEQEPTSLLVLFGAIAGLFMGLLVSGIIALIMKSSFNTRVNLASFIASNTLACIVSIIFVVVMAVFSADIWIISSVILWCSTYMLCLHFLQPPSLEQLLARTEKDVAKLEKQAEKMDKKAKAKEEKAKAKITPHKT